MIEDLGYGTVAGDGVYKTPLDHYHTQAICPGVSISSSGLRTILNKSPMDFWAFSDINLDRFERMETPALAFGRAAHALLLGDEVFDESFIVLPDDAPDKPTVTQERAAAQGRKSESYIKRKSFWDGFNAAKRGRTVILAEWMEHIRYMSESLGRHPLVNPLFEGHAEMSLIWKDVKTDIWLKARPDMVPNLDGGGVLADLKTTADASMRACMRDINVHGYDMQAAIGALAIEQILGHKITSSVAVFVQKTPPYHISPIEITEDALHWGKLKIRKALDVFAECLEKNDWPGPVEGIPAYHVPDWRLHEMAEGQEAGTFPKEY